MDGEHRLEGDHHVDFTGHDRSWRCFGLVERRDFREGNPLRAEPAGLADREGLAQIHAALLVSETDYQIQAIRRAPEEQIDNRTVKVLAVEDVIIHKLIAGRYQDLADIEAILETELAFDAAYIEHWVEFWDVQDRWRRIQRSSWSHAKA